MIFLGYLMLGYSLARFTQGAHAVGAITLLLALTFLLLGNLTK